MDKPILNKIDSEKSRKTQARLSAMIEFLGEIDEITDDTEDSLNEDHEYQTIDSSSSVSVLSDQFEPLRPTQLDFNSNIHTPPDQQLPSLSSSSNSTKNKRFSDNNVAINNNGNIIENAFDFVPQLQPQPQFQPLTSINSTPSISTSTHDPNTNDTSFNRCSMLSDYSGVIHEGTEVSYIVKNNTLNNNNDSNNTINTNNVTSTITKTDNSATITAITDNDNNNKFDSNHLSVFSQQPTAPNEVIIKQIKNAKHVNRFNSLRYDTPSKPPRSHLKYRSDPLLVMQEQTEKQLNNLSLKESLPNMVHDQDRSNLDSSFSVKSNVNYPSSVPSGIRNNKSNELTGLSLKDSERDGTTIPEESRNSNNHNNDTSAIPRAPPRNKNRPKTILIDQDLSNSELFPIPDSATLNKKNNDNTNISTDSNRNNMGGQQFNAHTISQLLSITNGTLIGSEFQDLPIPIEEKRALERLVDSLSRLTADMVLDPERYEQGLIRLKKAIRALEGFQ